MFEDISDPHDWEALASIESKTNPRIWEEIGQLDLIPPERRVGGPGASYLMAPFVHCSPDRPGRFSSGAYGVYSIADSEDAAIYEVAHHHARAMRATQEAAGWTSQFRMLIGTTDCELDDVRDDREAHNPDSWTYSQALAAGRHAAGSDGILYNSVRYTGGLCAAIFWPDVVSVPVQGDHYRLYWDGNRVDRVHNETTGEEYTMS